MYELGLDLIFFFFFSRRGSTEMILTKRAVISWKLPHEKVGEYNIGQWHHVPHFIHAKNNLIRY